MKRRAFHAPHTGSSTRKPREGACKAQLLVLSTGRAAASGASLF